MPSRQFIKVTYAHKKRRIQNSSKGLLSSPLEALSPETDDLTRTQMAHRMLKGSRHVDVAPEDDATFQTPFCTSHLHESVITKPLMPEPELSPVPAPKRFTSRTNSRKLKENSIYSHTTLASPFSSRPGSAASSPKHKGRGHSSHRALRNSLHKKSHTISGVFKENAQQVSRKFSTTSLRDMNREHQTRHIKRQRYPSSPSASYMRNQEDWIASPRKISRAFGDCDGVLSSENSIHGDASFYTGQPRFCSTPAMSRLASIGLQAGYIAEYNIPLSDIVHSPVSTVATEMFDQEGVPKISVGKQSFDFPGTSPARGMALVFRSRRMSSAPTPPASPSKTTAPYPPSSPASDLALDFGSLEICGGPDTCTIGETHRQSVPTPPLMRAHSLQEDSENIKATTKKYAKRILARKRAGTIRASDCVQSGHGASSSGCAPGPMVSSLSNVRRTRSGTVVGPESKLAAVPGPDPESDDELLLKAAWIEDMVYLGLATPADKGVEVDELNLSGPSSRPPCRLGLRRR